MKFNVNQQDLQKSLNYCQGVIEKRSTLPILSNILLDASNSKLTITATDLDLIFVHKIDNIEVIEIGVPAEHVTTIDHDMELPTKTINPEREFQGQKFVHNKADESSWSDFRIPGFQCRDTTIAENTKNVAGVQVVRPNGNAIRPSKHDCDILFNFVMEGTMTLIASGQSPIELNSGDAFVIPPELLTEYSNVSADLELLEVSLPGKFKTYYETSDSLVKR